ncbi:hypothetical protein [Flavobacterium flavigenum]|uniref:hypothetical protein n=1 Tax=Flavobacterium flavigenum TaxID=3003258 RepID=UPI0022ABEA9D|nr:hypothetical protein [Flavobacterium flavigenum]
MKILRKEILWIIASLIISCLIWHPFLPFNFSDFNSTVDINIHDTYFIVVSIHILFFIIANVFFIVYSIRILISRLRNTIINGIFLFSNTLMIIVMSYLISVTKSLIIEAGWTIYPPLSANIQIHEDNGMKNIYYTFIGIEISLVIILFLVAVKTVINIKRSRKANN